MEIEKAQRNKEILKPTKLTWNYTKKKEMVNHAKCCRSV